MSYYGPNNCNQSFGGGGEHGEETHQDCNGGFNRGGDRDKGSEARGDGRSFENGKIAGMYIAVSENLYRR
jgi:hypothetical protein